MPDSTAANSYNDSAPYHYDPTQESNEPVTYNAERVIGNGSFGIVYMAQVVSSKKYVAIKKVFQDKRYRNRELQILEELRNAAKQDVPHPNIIHLISPFHTKGDRPDELFLNLVMEYIPDTLYNTARNLRLENNNRVPEYFIMLYTYQLLRSLCHLKAHQIMHRDIKPQNLLVDVSNNNILKLCDFGSAKKVMSNNPSVQYICSRYYRAPELIFGVTNYGCAIDMWSSGCVMGELVNNGQPIFPGQSGVDQLVEIIKVLGTPSKADVVSMNNAYLGYKFDFQRVSGRPLVRNYSFQRVSGRPLTDILPPYCRANKDPNTGQTIEPENVRFLSRMLKINPSKRVDPFEGLCDSYFDPLREKRFHDTPSGSVVIPMGLQKFTNSEIGMMTSKQKEILMKKPKAF